MPVDRIHIDKFYVFIMHLLEKQPRLCPPRYTSNFENNVLDFH